MTQKTLEDHTKSNPENNPDEKLEGEIGLQPDESTDIYPNAEVRISRMQFSLLHIKRLYEERGELIIDPEFQRHSVWSAKQRSELIESILMGIPLPIVYLFESKDGSKQVVDGRQRITAIIDYLNDKFKLSELKILHTLNGKHFSRLDPKLQGIIEDFQLLAYVIQPPTAERVKYDIFDRVNRGGTSLNAQEMRNALYGGASTKLIDKICRSTEFIDATNRGISPKRMRDRYVTLRAMAFTSLFKDEFPGAENHTYEYRSDIDDFLARYMTAVNHTTLTESEIDAKAEGYRTIFKRIHDTLGCDAFRFESITGKRRPINMPLVETLVYMFSILPQETDTDIFKNKLDEWKRQLDNTNLFKFGIDSTTNVYLRKAEVEKFVASL